MANTLGITGSTTTTNQPVVATPPTTQGKNTLGIGVNASNVNSAAPAGSAAVIGNPQNNTANQVKGSFNGAGQFIPNSAGGGGGTSGNGTTGNIFGSNLGSVTGIAGNSADGTATLVGANGAPIVGSTASFGNTSGSSLATGNINPTTGTPNGVQIVGAATNVGSTPTFVDPATGNLVSNSNTSGGIFGLGTQNFSTYNINPSASTNQALPSEENQLTGYETGIQGQQSVATQAAGQAPTTLGVANTSAGTQSQNQFMNAQGNTVNQLQQEANGQGPAAQSIQLQSQNAVNQGLANQAALAASTRGGNAGQNLQNAETGMASVTGNAANQAALNTANAETLGINNVGSAEAAGQNEAITEAANTQANQQFNATQGQQNSQFNAGQANTGAQQAAGFQQSANTATAAAANTQQLTADQLIAQGIAQGDTMEQAQAAANQQLATQNAQLSAQQQAAKVGVAENAASNQSNAAAAGASAFGTALSAFSDEKLKKDIKPGDKELQNYLDSLMAKSFEYKDEKFGKGRQLGIMAQDVEKTSIGAQMVENHPEGKVLNIAKGYTAIMAAQDLLNRRLKELEN